MTVLVAGNGQVTIEFTNADIVDVQDSANKVYITDGLSEVIVSQNNNSIILQNQVQAVDILNEMNQVIVSEGKGLSYNITVSNTAPLNPSVNDLWVDTN